LVFSYVHKYDMPAQPVLRGSPRRSQYWLRREGERKVPVKNGQGKKGNGLSKKRDDNPFRSGQQREKRKGKKGRLFSFECAEEKLR